MNAVIMNGIRTRYAVPVPDRTGNSTVAGLAARYPGSKNGSGVWQVILNNIPPHDLWIEAFAGTAVVTRRKRPAASSIVIDADAAACRYLNGVFADAAGHTVVCADVRRYIEEHGAAWNERTCLYCDPPYLFKVRSSRRRRYKHEFGCEWQHEDLLELLVGLRCKVLLSGYASALYTHWLDPENCDCPHFHFARHWRRVDYQTMTPGGPRRESLWCNFPEPTALHDYSAVGADYRQRQDLKRQRQRWLARLAAMPPLKRQVLLGAIDEWRRTCPPGE